MCASSPPINEITIRKTSRKPYVAEKSAQDILLLMGAKTINELKKDLSDKTLVESGFTVRDFALGTLISMHHFNIEKAFSKNEKLKTKRKIAYFDSVGKRKEITLFSDAEDEHFEAALAYLKEEKWPITTYGMYLKLLETKESPDPTLVYAFQLSKEFKNLELLMHKASVAATLGELLNLILEAPFDNLKLLSSSVFDEDSKEAKREFLLSTISLGSETAASILLRSDFEFAIKKIDDRMALKILTILTKEIPQSRKFALALLLSPRGENVWDLAAKKMYELSEESVPESLTRHQALQRFAPVVLTRNEELKHEEEPKKIVTALLEKKQTIPKVVEKPLQTQITKKSKRAYIVQEGDTLWKVGKRYNADPTEIRKLNDLASDYLKPGTLIKLP